MRSQAARALAGLARAQDREAGRGGLTRRAFALRTLAAATGAVLAPVASFGSSNARGRERIAIVGAGIAGLSCALTLRDAGIDATVFESSARLGGRMHSERGYWDDGQHTEWCGSMIDTTHVHLHALARRFGLALVDSAAALPSGARDTAYFEHRYYPAVDVDRDFAPVYKILREQMRGVGPSTTWDKATPLARTLDAMSMQTWIERYIPGGATSRFGRLIANAYMNEYGRACSEQSALNLVYMLGAQRDYPRNGELDILGYSDQRYFIRDGNQQLPLAIARALPAGSIRMRHALRSIAKRSGGTYELRFNTPNGESRQPFDRVVLALPFSVLRSLDYAGAGFDARKTKAIDELGYGYHTKLHLQFRRPTWRGAGPWQRPTTGQIWTDLGFQDSVDFTVGQSGASGIIERFTGGTAGLVDVPEAPYTRMGGAPAVERQVKTYLSMLDAVWPGVSRAFNGKATLGNAQVDPNIRASYSCWLIGQYTSIAGYEGVRQGRIHFAGEHCSVDSQGFMEGGAATGISAAREILRDYNVRVRSAV
ncbi:MAG: hypothetical protein NVS3B7_12110 [Candidatus Elarobacter sp.]